MNKEIEQIAKYTLTKLRPNGYTDEDVQTMVSAFALVAKKIEERQSRLPRGAEWNMASWVVKGGQVVL